MGRDVPRPRRRRGPLPGQQGQRTHKGRRAGWLGAAVLAIAVLAGACLALRPLQRRLVDGDQPATGVGRAAALGPGATAGQTLVARHAGLAGIELWVDPGSAAPLTLTLHLRAEPAAGQDLAVSTAALPAGAGAGFYRFDWPAQADSLGRYYYAWVETAAEAVSLPLAEGAAYLDGAAYQDGEPLDAQTAFRLVYAPGPLLGDLAGAVPRAIGLVGAALVALALPGWALLTWLGPAVPTTWGERLGLSAGIGLALLPLVVLWADVVGLQLRAGVAWLPIGLGLVCAVWQARRWRPRQWAQAAGRWARSEAAAPDLTLLAVLTLLVASRLLVARTLEVPLYGDGYQHTMITQLLVDHGGLFDSWQPYSAIDRFTYHFGFHTAAAVLHWLTGLPVVESVLWTGQVLNILAIVALYPLAVWIGGGRWAGVACVVVAGLLSPMPSEYVNWGRYTQLAGQAVLPAAVWLTWEMLAAPTKKWRAAALVAIVSAGLALTHYRVLAFFAAFVVVLLPLELGRRPRRAAFLRLAAAALGGALLFLPWLAHTFEGSAIHILGHQLSTMPAEVSAFARENNAVGKLGRYLAPGWWAAAAAALVWAVWKRRPRPLAAGLWSAVMVLAANPAWLGLPGTGAISSFAILIAAYLPAGLLVGFLAAEAVEAARRLPGRRLLPAALALLAVAAGTWGAGQRLRDLDLAKGAYVTRPDVRAAAWIRENTEQDARFLVNSSPAYGGTAVVGTDGGWWLPLLAGRQNSVPPLSYATELNRSSPLRQQMEGPARLEEGEGAAGQAQAAALRAAGVTHVYIGQRQGAVNDSTAVTLAPEQLVRSPAYQLVYHEDRVWIFRLAPEGSDR